MNQVKGSGASSTLFQHDRPNKPKISRFDLSRKVNFSIDTGMIVPIDLIETYPGDSFRIGLKMSLDTLPLVAPSLTNYKITTHWYYMKKRDMWKGWKTFSTKGRSGNVKLLVPQVDLSYPLDKPNAGTVKVTVDGVQKSVNGYHYPVSSHSLSAFVGVPASMNGFYGLVTNGSSASAFVSKNYLPYSFKIIDNGDLTSEQVDTYNKAVETGFNNYSKVSALPFVMYQSICKNFYVNPNLLQDNKALFPIEGDDDWLLPYSIPSGVANYISGRAEITSDDKINISGVYSSDETDVDLRLLRYAEFDDDYFTTALKDLQRGDETSISLSVFDGSFVPVTIEGNETDGRLKVSSTGGADAYDASYSVLGNLARFYAHSGQSYGSIQFSRTNTDLNSPKNVGLNTALLNKISGVSITANQLRQLIAMSVWQERNQRVDGSYSRMIYQHWNVNPRSEEHRPVYIGGTVDYLNFSTVIQNSQSTSSSPLGSTAGFGSSGGDGSVCSDFQCPDHGYIMGVMIVRPETIYQQGVDRLLTEITFDDFAQPEFQGLSPESILNKEVYISGTSEDDKLLAYQERYTYLKVRQNCNRGLMQCKPGKDILFSAYTQARWFDSLPQFSYQFLCMSPDNIRRDWLAFPAYPAFRCQLLSEVFATRSLSYTSEPETFGF